MANITELINLFRYVMFIGTCCGLRGFYFDNIKGKFRMFYMGNKKWQSYFSWLIYIIVLLSGLVYIYLRINVELHNNELNKLEPGVCHKAEFAMAYLDCTVTVLMLLCFINFKRNQQNFVNVANDLLFIHSIVISLLKEAIRCCMTLKMLTQLLLAQIIGKYVIFILLGSFNVHKSRDSYQLYLILINSLRLGAELLCDLHFLLLVLCFTLLTSYYWHFNYFLLYKNESKKTFLKRLQKILLLLPKLQNVEHFLVTYSCLQFILRFLLLLKAFHQYVDTFKYDFRSLHPFVGADEDDEFAADKYQEPRIPRNEVVYSNSVIFVLHVLDLIITLIAAHALRVEKLQLLENLLDLVNFPLHFRKIENTTGLVSEQESSQLQADPNAIIESDLHTEIPQSYILDMLFKADFKIRKLKSNAEVFFLRCRHFKVPLKRITAICKLIVYSAFVLLVFDIMQQAEINKLEHLSASREID